MLTSSVTRASQRQRSSTEEQVNEKKRKNQQRVLDVEKETFTTLVFGTNGGMGAECQLFLKNVAEKLSRKDRKLYAIVNTWLRCLLRF